MKSERLSNGVGNSNTPHKYYFDGVTFQVFSDSGTNVSLIGKKSSQEVLSIRIDRVSRTFEVVLAKGAPINIEHLYAVEKLLQSYAMTFRFPLLMVLLPIYDSLESFHGFTHRGFLETFPE